MAMCWVSVVTTEYRALYARILRNVGYSPPGPILVVTEDRLNPPAFTPLSRFFRILLEVPKELLLRRPAGERVGWDGVRSRVLIPNVSQNNRLAQDIVTSIALLGMYIYGVRKCMVHQ